MLFGKRLKQLRSGQKMTQQDLAKLLNVSPSTIGMYEQGRRDPDTDAINFLANLFKVTTDYLLGRTEYPSEIHELGTLGADRYIKKHGIHKLSEITSDNDIEVEREVQAFKEKGKIIDRATAQMLVEHRRRILAGDEGSIDYIYQAETLGDALLRIAELDYEYDFDEETFAKLVIKAREKYGLPSVGGPESAGHSSDHLSPGIFEAGNPAFNCIHEDKLEYNDKENAALKPKQQKPSYEEHVLSAKTLADASIRIADLFNDYQIDEDEYLRLNTLAYRKFGLPPVPGAEQAAHTKHNIPGTGVFENDKKD